MVNFDGISALFGPFATDLALVAVVGVLHMTRRQKPFQNYLSDGISAQFDHFFRIWPGWIEGGIREPPWGVAKRNLASCERVV